MARWASPDLVSAALSGGKAAAEQLIAVVWPHCFRLAAAIIGDCGLAQDAAQEACVIVHRKIRSLRNADAFDAWLYRIVIRESARARRRHEITAAPMYELGSKSEVATTIDVWRALADLSPALRDVTVLFYFDDLKSDEIAAILRIPHPTVRTRLARAREHLRHLLGDYAVEERPTPPEMKQHAF